MKQGDSTRDQTLHLPVGSHEIVAPQVKIQLNLVQGVWWRWSGPVTFRV